MAEIINMPKLGFDMAEGTLVRWVILEGESVSKGAILAEIETDKATVEVESHHEGVMYQHLVPEGEIVPINAPIAVVAEPEEEVDINDLLDSADAEADKPVRAEVDTESESQKIEEKEIVSNGKQDKRLPGGVKASPIARRIAQEMGIDLQVVRGSGPGGRITKKDVENYLSSPAEEAKLEHKAPVDEAVELPPLSITTVDDVEPKPSKTIPLNRLRAAIGKRMAEAKQQSPHFYVTHEYRVGALVNLRKQYNTLLPKEEKISINDFIVKAAALTLIQYPNLNASLDGDQVIQHGHINIGVAVAVEGGLLTIVCHDADIKPIHQIAQETRSMVQRAREGKVRPDDIEGSTFTVSNMGMFDVDHFIAIINPPEAAIFAVGSAKEVPVIEDGEIKPGLRMKATLSVDHRVSDGAEAAQFLQAMAVHIENPLRLLF
jgi:pyruvate dehydrogenase E2 component (dihydrolipoamide acetyltransferase)